MKFSKIVFLLSSVFSTLLISAEPSAFGAGNLNSPKPYGLTSNEKVILDTKNRLQKVSVKSNNQANKLDSLRERIDGLQSIIESLGRKAHNNKINLLKQHEKNSVSDKNINEYEKRLSTIVSDNSKNINDNLKLIEQQKILITDMSILIDTINTKYVSKEEFNTLVNDVNTFKILIAKELKESAKKTGSSKLESMSSASIYNDAMKFYKKKYYTRSIEYYKYLIVKKYKPAFAHYMIGEMYFKRKNYANAISYFKKSSSLYSKAKYMPSLMLHTAVSMSKTGDDNHANSFFNAIVSKYPGSVEAKEAKMYLQP